MTLSARFRPTRRDGNKNTTTLTVVLRILRVGKSYRPWAININNSTHKARVRWEHRGTCLAIIIITLPTVRISLFSNGTPGRTARSSPPAETPKTRKKKKKRERDTPRGSEAVICSLFHSCTLHDEGSRILFSLTVPGLPDPPPLTIVPSGCEYLYLARDSARFVITSRDTPNHIAAVPNFPSVTGISARNRTVDDDFAWWTDCLPSAWVTSIQLGIERIAENSNIRQSTTESNSSHSFPIPYSDALTVLEMDISAFSVPFGLSVQNVTRIPP